MKFITLLAVSLAVLAVINATCTDTNASGTNCYCNAGFYGTSSDNAKTNAGTTGPCLACQPGVTTATAPASVTTFFATCNACYDAQATFSMTAAAGGTPGCACNKGYTGTPATTSGATGCKSGSLILSAISLLSLFAFLI
ncbi:hypothetical protein ABPG74_006659 [Tetrahymena malaccensis]